MTKIVANHRLAHTACLAVSTVLAKAGALAESIKNDYGEDLLVQTQLHDDADSFKIWIQVKGTSLKKSADGFFRYRFKVDHLRRWALNIEPMLVCIYNEENGVVYAFDPRDYFTVWELHSTSDHTKSIKFTEGNVFDEGTAKHYIWESRTRHFSAMLALTENSRQYGYDNNKRRDKILRKEIVMISYEYLRSIGVVADGSISSSFVKLVMDSADNLKENGKEYGFNINCAFILALLNHVHDLFGGGLPGNLLEHCHDIGVRLFSELEKDKWLKASSHFTTGG
ncbi:MAG: DUF4365 domain-containing protein [Rhodospirillaceae bacterium]|nr:DUF4365 domain-containing protein [Rhodospirillales bacterium]